MDPLVQSAWLLLVVLGGYLALRGLLKWIGAAPARPEPWGEAVEAQLQQAETAPLCPRCLRPQPEASWFCPDCGLPASATTNLSPFLYIFSLGDAFRAFAAGGVPARLLTGLGYGLVAVAEFALLAPLYWLFLFGRRLRSARPAEPPPPAVAAG